MTTFSKTIDFFLGSVWGVAVCIGLFLLMSRTDSGQEITANVVGNPHNMVMDPEEFAYLPQRDRVNLSDISVLKDLIIIREDDTYPVTYAPTGSMLPCIAQETNGIYKGVGNESELSLLDVVSFYDSDDNVITHRIIEMGNDTEGWYAITQGDNNKVGDGKIRFGQIKGVLVALVY